MVVIAGCCNWLYTVLVEALLAVCGLVFVLGAEICFAGFGP